MNACFHYLTRIAFCFLFALVSAGCTTNSTTPIAQKAPKILLLGEVHDNPEGHRQRFDYLQTLIAAGWRPAVAMEQFDRENQTALTRAQADCANADCVILAAGGKRWEWKYYQPIIDLALRYKLPLLAANVSRAEAGRVVREGLPAAFDAATISAFGLGNALPPDLFEAQRDAINTGHCGMLPAAMAQGMVNAQVARDVWMAKVLLENVANGAVLLAGNGHVRRDIGVVRWLPEADAKATQIHGYVESDAGDSTLAYDITHLIVPHQRPDPCKALTVPLPK